MNLLSFLLGGEGEEDHVGCARCDRTIALGFVVRDRAEDGFVAARSVDAERIAARMRAEGWREEVAGDQTNFYCPACAAARKAFTS